MLRELFGSKDSKMGKQARDKVTGFEGIITARCEYLTGCAQYGISPPAKDGKVENTLYFDEGRVEVIGAGVTAESVASAKTGGPNRDAPQR